MIKINNFRGDLTDISAKKEALLRVAGGSKSARVVTDSEVLRRNSVDEQVSVAQKPSVL